MLTGFHGAHVTLGTIMLAIIWLRCAKGHFSKDAHFAFEAVAWYWHFVDVVWLGLFLFVYVMSRTRASRPRTTFPHRAEKALPLLQVTPIHLWCHPSQVATTPPHHAH